MTERAATNTPDLRLRAMVARLQEHRRRTVTANDTFTEGDDLLLCDTAGGNVTVTFPLAERMLGHRITLSKSAAANTLTGAATGSDVLEPVVSYTEQYRTVTYEAVSPGKWRIVWHYAPYVGGVALTDGDKGDIIVSGGGTTFTLDTAGTAGDYDLLTTDSKGRVIAGARRVFDVAAHYAGNLSNAIAAAVAAGGGIVQLPAGITTLNSGVTIGGNNVWIRGQGAGVSILQAAPATTFPYLIYATARTFLTLSDLTIDANGTNRTAATNTLECFRFDSFCNDYRVYNVELKGSLGLAAGPVSSDACSITGHRGRIQSVVLRDCGQPTRPSDGMYLVGDDVWVNGVHGDTVGDTGVAFVNCNRPIANNISLKTTGCVVAHASGQAADIKGGVFTNITGTGGTATTVGVLQLITLSTGHIVDTLVDNVALVSSTGGAAVVVTKGSTGEFRDLVLSNVIVDGAATQAMLINGGRRIRIVSPHLRGAVSDTVRLAGCTDVTVEGGYIEVTAVSGVGIYADACVRVHVQGTYLKGDDVNAAYGVYYNGDSSQHSIDPSVRIQGFTIARVGRSGAGAHTEWVTQQYQSDEGGVTFGLAQDAGFYRPTGSANTTSTIPSTKLVTQATASARAGFNLPHGTAPSSPVNGDLWTTTAGAYVRINGTTVGPLGTGGGGGGINSATGTVDFGATELDHASVTVSAGWITGSSNITACVDAVTTADHDPFDAWAENLGTYCEAPGTGSVVVHVYAPRQTWGRYQVRVLGS